MILRPLFLVLLAGWLILGGSGCRPKPEPAARVKVALNWFPEAEHGGFYAAQVQGYFHKKGLDVEILAGGPDAPVIQRVATGQVDFGVANADDVLNARAQKAPVVAIFAPYQINPRCIMVHAESGVTKIGDIRDMTLAMSQRPAFSHYLKHKFPLTGVKIVPYPGNISQFLLDKKFAQQGYVFSEPFVARKKGANPQVLMVADIGFNPYASVLIATEDTIRQHPQKVADIVAASRAGWESYLKDPEPVNKYIQTLNPEMDLEILAFGAKESKALVDDGKHPIGHMAPERWQQLLDQMVEIGLIKAGAVKAGEAFTTRFLR